jgi:predicted ArsR family transcriptional regulator
MSDSIQRRRERRREFLRQLYLRVDGSISEFVNAYELGTELGIDEVEVRKIFEYLEEKQLVMVDDHRAGIVRITAAGVDEVESRA